MQQSHSNSGCWWHIHTHALSRTVLRAGARTQCAYTTFVPSTRAWKKAIFPFGPQKLKVFAATPALRMATKTSSTFSNATIYVTIPALWLGFLCLLGGDAVFLSAYRHCWEFIRLSLAAASSTHIVEAQTKIPTDTAFFKPAHVYIRTAGDYHSIRVILCTSSSYLWATANYRVWR